MESNLVSDIKEMIEARIKNLTAKSEKMTHKGKIMTYAKINILKDLLKDIEQLKLAEDSKEELRRIVNNQPKRFVNNQNNEKPEDKIIVHKIRPHETESYLVCCKPVKVKIRKCWFIKKYDNLV